MQVCVAHRDSPRQDCAHCDSYVAHMDTMGDHAEDQHNLFATQLVSIAEQVGVPCAHADALFCLEKAGQDMDLAMAFVLASDFTVSSTLPAWPDNGCGPASQPNDDVSAFTFDAVVQPQKQYEEVHSPGVSHEQRQVMGEGRPEAISSTGLSKFDHFHMGADHRAVVGDDQPHAVPSNGPSKFEEFQIGAAPFHNVRVALMNPGCAGQIVGHLSTKLTLHELVLEVCRILGAPGAEVQILNQGNELEHHTTLTDSGVHLPRRNGTVDLTLYFSQIIELHPFNNPKAFETSVHWEDSFHINGGKSRMCDSCGSGPMINEQCSDMAAHNERNQNACKFCGWHRRKWEDWPLWDGGKKRRVYAASRA